MLNYIFSNKDNALTLFLIFSVFFGFYIGPVRLDQVLLYVVATFLFFSNVRAPLRIDTLLSAYMILCVIFLGFLGVILGKTLSFERSALSVISQLENYLQIIAILLICDLKLRHLDRKSSENALNFFFVCICLNAILVCASIYVFTPSMLDIFHGGVITERADAYANGMSPSALSAQAGRHTGLFGQVFIAGTMHALALTMLVASFRARSHVLNAIYLGFIIYGGILTGSKVFVFWTIPALLLFLYLARVKLKVALLALAGILATIAGLANIIALPWYFRRLYGGLINFDLQASFHIFTSSRFLPGSSITYGIERAFQESPVFGYGFGTLKTSDFAFYEVLAISGLLGTFIYILFLLLLYSRLLLDKEHAWTGLALLLLVLLASISGPVITGNKIAFFLIVIPTLFLLTNGSKK